MLEKKENKRALRYIMDTFSGADGGMAFINFLVAMETIEAECSESGDKLLQIMKDFSNLITILQNKREE